MATLTMPTTPGFTDTKFGLRANTRIFRSPLSNSVQTVEAQGAHWEMTISLPPMKREEAVLWQTFFMKLRGQAGRFYAFDPKGKTNRGAVSGENPIVDGGGQTGTSLNTKDWTAFTTNVLREGDYIEVNGEYKYVTEDVDSGSAGVATIKFEPPLRNSPGDGVAIDVQTPRVVMKLKDDLMDWDESTLRLYGISFSAEEAFQT